MRFDFTPAERGVWYDLLVLAGNCRMDGVVAAGQGKPYPYSWIAGTLNVPLKLLETTLEKCRVSERIHENNDGIHIQNWKKYQSEYERQKPYRERKKTQLSESESGESLSAGDSRVISVWRAVKGFKMNSATVVDLVVKLRTDFPDVDILAESKKWAARKLSEPLTSHSRPAGQIYNWVAQRHKWDHEGGNKNREYGDSGTYKPIEAPHEQ
jgi:hypothetical protein